MKNSRNFSLRKNGTNKWTNVWSHWILWRKIQHNWTIKL